MKKMYSIKQVSDKTNIKPYVLRYYENEGLIPSIKRNDKGIRQYTDEDLDWLCLICCLKNTGMPIKKIKKFVELSMEGNNTLKERCDILNEHKENIERKIEETKELLDKIKFKIDYFNNLYIQHKNSNASNS